MVGIVEIVLNENRSAELGLTDNQVVTAGNGVRYKWAGAAWVVDDNNGVSGVRNGSMANREMSAGLTNLGRQQNGLPPLTFGSDGKPVSQDKPTSSKPDSPRVNVATMDHDDLFDEKDLTRSERRKLSRTGRIQRNGMNFTKQDIRAMGERLQTIRKRRGERIDAERKPTMDDYKKSKKAIGNIGRHGVLGSILSLGAGVGVFSKFRQVLLQTTDKHDKKLAQISQDSTLSAEQKAEEIAKEIESYYKKQAEIFVAQLVPLTVALFTAVKSSATAVGVIVRAYRLALLSGTQLASIAGGPVTFFSALAVNTAIFVLTEVGMYFAIRWMLSTKTGQGLILGFIHSELLKTGNKIFNKWSEDGFGEFAAWANAEVESQIGPIMDQIHSGAADTIEFTNNMVNSSELDRVQGQDAANRLRREWDKQSGATGSIQGPDTSGETFDSPRDRAPNTKGETFDSPFD